MKKVIKINGMSCDHCTKRVESALLNIEGVLSAKVDLKNKQAMLESKNAIDEELIKNVIEDLGYEVIS